MIQALIFDVDGTLAETEELHRAAFNRAFAHFELGWHWSQSDYRSLLKTTGGKERISAFAHEQGHLISSDEVARLHQWKTNSYAELMKTDGIKLRSGIEALIAQGRAQNMKLAIATTTNLPNVEALAQSAFGRAASDIFDAIAAGDMVKNKKPAPDVYQLALHQLGLAPEHCLAFEDTLNGVKSAKGAGLRVVLSQSIYSKGEEAGDADFVLDEFTQALQILEL